MSNQTRRVPSHMQGATLSDQTSHQNQQQQGQGSGKPNQPRDGQKPQKGGQRR